MNIIFGSVCSGIEAASVAWHPLGWRAAWLAEIEPFPSHVLHHHYGSGRPLNMPSPDDDGLSDDDRDSRRAALKSVARLPDTIAADAPRNLGDFTRIAAMVRSRAVAAPDVLVGGTPCQAFSIAGLRNSLGDARGQLTLAFVDLANAIDTTRLVDGKPAAIIVWENVPGVLSTKDNAFGCFLGALAGEDCALVSPGGKWPNAGCVVGPQRAIAWRVTDAQYFGVAQRRRRVFVVASARKGFDPTEVLFEFDGLRRDSAPSRQAGQDAAVGTLRSTDGGSDVDHALAGQLQPVGADSGVICMAHGQGGAEIARERRTTLTCNHEAPIVAAPIAFSSKDYGGDACYDLAPTLRAGNHSTSHANGGQLPAIAFDARQDCVSSTDVFGALGSSSPQAQAVSYAIQAGALRTNPNSGPDGVGVQEHIAYTLEARAEVQAICITGDITHTLKAECFDASEDGTGRGQPIVATAGAMCAHTYSGGSGGRPDLATQGYFQPVGMAVRRLTPRECERLQAFPDFYTLIPMGIVKASRAETMLAKGDPVECIDGIWWKLSADGPRYKALGNSMCTENMAWIGRRIELALMKAAEMEAA